MYIKHSYETKDIILNLLKVIFNKEILALMYIHNFFSHTTHNANSINIGLCCICTFSNYVCNYARCVYTGIFLVIHCYRSAYLATLTHDHS